MSVPAGIAATDFSRSASVQATIDATDFSRALSAPGVVSATLAANEAQISRARALARLNAQGQLLDESGRRLTPAALVGGRGLEGGRAGVGRGAALRRRAWAGRTCACSVERARVVWWLLDGALRNAWQLAWLAEKLRAPPLCFACDYACARHCTHAAGGPSRWYRCPRWWRQCWPLVVPPANGLSGAGCSPPAGRAGAGAGA